MCKYIYMYIYMYIRIHTYICIRIYMYIYTCIHLYECKDKRLPQTPLWRLSGKRPDAKTTSDQVSTSQSGPSRVIRPSDDE